jgi:hypothetical protein
MAAPKLDERDVHRAMRGRFDPSKVRVLWAPFPGMQTEAVRSTEFEVLVGGAKGPGKSDVLLAKMAKQTDKERYKGYILRETGPQLDELKARSHRYYGRMASKPAWHGDGHGRWTWPSGAQVIFESIGTVDDAEKIQGKEPSAVGHDEVGNVKDERVVDLVQAELRSPDPSIRRFWLGSANPGKAGHGWIKRRFINPCGVDGRRILVRKVTLPNGEIARLTRRFIPGTVLDNPIYANDPLYMAQLATLPDVLRRQLLYGDWNAGVGTALDELDAGKHLIRPFRIPSYWTHFGAFDWGYAHWWVLCWFTADEDGNLFVVDTARGRRHKPRMIAERMKARAPIERLEYIDTDYAVFQSRKDRNDNTPTVAEEMQEYGVILRPATNLDRRKRLNYMRLALAWKGLGFDGGDGVPMLRFFDTPGNRWLFDQLGDMQTDEDDPEDVMKVNADPVTGAGGDDGYDALSLGVVSRPARAIGQFYKGPVQAFSQQTLTFMVEHLYRDRDLPEPAHGLGNLAGLGGDLSTFLHGV